MQITIDLPDNLPLTEADVRRELAIVLYQQHNLHIHNNARAIAQPLVVGLVCDGSY
ncbi:MULTISPECIES: hypothetical protein [Kamptonema]|uniref:hypothetical protein n=1 Tax=Kamptonema TaxID=1501433 RepID=UPI0001DAD171|nr:MULTISPECIES: hypothetical protein [Kamptonema]CBN54637.1 hypothetical protein OSCI_1000030 [Kamptonema sp. PCC 6506]